MSPSDLHRPTPTVPPAIPPTLLLLPGMDGTGDLFAPLVAALGEGVEIKIVRYPNDQAWGYAEHEAFARAARPIDAPYFILGESFSGPIAIALAASNPGQVRGLILCATFARNPRPMARLLSALLPLAPMKRISALALSAALLGSFTTPTLRAALAEAQANVATRTLRARLAAVVSVDVTLAYAALAVPVLYLRAAKDRLVPRAAGQLLAELNPGTRIVTLDAPHAVLQVAAKTAAAEIRAFIASTSITENA